MDFYLFQGAAFLETGEGEGPLLLLLSIEPQECSLSPGSGPECHLASSCHALPSTGERHSIPSVTLGFQGLTAFARPCESSTLFTVVLDQDYLETLRREGDLASYPLWYHRLISVVEER